MCSRLGHNMMILDLCYVYKVKVTIILIFLHLFELIQTLFTADGFRLLLQLQPERFAAAGGAAVLADGRVVSAEILHAGVAAKLMESLVQGQLTRGLRKIKDKGAVSTIKQFRGQ